jgi:hypothetical protein
MPLFVGLLHFVLTPVSYLAELQFNFISVFVLCHYTMREKPTEADGPKWESKSAPYTSIGTPCSHFAVANAQLDE